VFLSVILCGICFNDATENAIFKTIRTGVDIMFYKSAIVGIFALLMSVNVLAEGSSLEKPPVIPEPLADGESIEPEVNIIQRDDRTIEEYRVGGQLYMIKVTPSIGKPYYLIDNDGDGSFETTQHDLDDAPVPNWILLEW
jgi:hypothetical protein